MFIELLGNDSQLLTEEPIKSFDDYQQVNGKVDVIGKRSYVVGKYEIDKTDQTSFSK